MRPAAGCLPRQKQCCGTSASCHFSCRNMLCICSCYWRAAVWLLLQCSLTVVKPVEGCHVNGLARPRTPCFHYHLIIFCIYPAPAGVTVPGQAALASSQAARRSQRGKCKAWHADKIVCYAACDHQRFCLLKVTNGLAAACTISLCLATTIAVISIWRVAVVLVCRDVCWLGAASRPMQLVFYI